MAKTITSANAVLTITAAGVFPAPQRIQGFATDKAWDVPAVKRTEVVMGVDGHMSAGYTPKEVPMTISLQADSPSKDIFAAIDEASQTTREVVEIAGTLVLNSTGESWTFTRGFLTNYMPVPSGQKTLQPQDIEITWESARRAIL